MYNIEIIKELVRTNLNVMKGDSNTSTRVGLKQDDRVAYNYQFYYCTRLTDELFEYCGIFLWSKYDGGLGHYGLITYEEYDGDSSKNESVDVALARLDEAFSWTDGWVLVTGLEQLPSRESVIEKYDYDSIVQDFQKGHLLLSRETEYHKDMIVKSLITTDRRHFYCTNLTDNNGIVPRRMFLAIDANIKDSFIAEYGIQIVD